MRLLLSALGLVIVSGLVGWLGTRQLASMRGLPSVPGAVQVPASASASASASSSSQAQQARQIQQNYQQAIEGALRQPRPTGDDVR
jgi:hypothetical protein